MSGSGAFQHLVLALARYKLGHSISLLSELGLWLLSPNQDASLWLSQNKYFVAGMRRKSGELPKMIRIL